MDEQTIGHETMSNDEQLASGERMRQRNLTLDWKGIDLERMRRMKQVRANAKCGLTNAIKRVSNALTVGEEAVEIQLIEQRLDEAFQNFTEAWEQHRNLLDDGEDLEEAAAYFQEAKANYLCSKDRVALWLEAKRNCSWRGETLLISSLKTQYARLVNQQDF